MALKRALALSTWFEYRFCPQRLRRMETNRTTPCLKFTRNGKAFRAKRFYLAPSKRWRVNLLTDEEIQRLPETVRASILY
jgi:hypothetical protein